MGAEIRTSTRASGKRAAMARAAGSAMTASPSGLGRWRRMRVGRSAETGGAAAKRRSPSSVATPEGRSRVACRELRAPMTSRRAARWSKLSYTGGGQWSLSSNPWFGLAESAAAQGCEPPGQNTPDAARLSSGPTISITRQRAHTCSPPGSSPACSSTSSSRAPLPPRETGSSLGSRPDGRGRRRPLAAGRPAAETSPAPGARERPLRRRDRGERRVHGIRGRPAGLDPPTQPLVRPPPAAGVLEPPARAAVAREPGARAAGASGHDVRGGRRRRLRAVPPPRRRRA